MMNFIINGVPGNTIDCSDRGLHYGDGLFETIAFRSGKLQRWQAHLARMALACERLGLPMVTESQWLDDIRQLPLSGNDAVIKLILTRGTGGRGYAAPAQVKMTRIVAAYPWPSPPPENAENGIQVTICKTPVSINPRLAGIKHLNRLDNVMARSEWTDPNIAEGLMLDDHKHVIEGTMSNLFAIKNSKILTPRLTRAGVRGVMRSAVLQSCTLLNLTHEEVDIKLDALFTMDELFICNSIIGIWPVNKLLHQEYAIGPLTKQIMNRLSTEDNGHVV